MPSYIENQGIKPKGVYYSFKQSEIEKLVIDFVKEKTGFTLNLTVGCLDEDFDVYVSWGEESESVVEEFIKSQENKNDSIFISTEEDFINRDSIFSAMFGTEKIGFEYNDNFKEADYTIFVHADEDGDVTNEGS